jgi:uncharacterized membrane protein YjjP (DUF1212 family)
MKTDSWMHTKNTDIILEVGKELMECGAESIVIEECLLLLAKKFGYADISLTVLPKSILISADRDGHKETKMKHIGEVHPDFTKLAAIYKACVCEKEEDSIVLSSKLMLIMSYNSSHKARFITTPIAVAAFAGIFGCSFYGAGLAFGASLLSFGIKELVLVKYLNPMLANLVSAFMATLLVFVFGGSLSMPELIASQAAAVIFLVPGVQLINAFEDLLKGHYLNGVARGMRAFFLTFGVVAGIVCGLFVEKAFG